MPSLFIYLAVCSARACLQLKASGNASANIWCTPLVSIQQCTLPKGKAMVACTPTAAVCTIFKFQKLSSRVSFLSQFTVGP